MDIEWDEHWAGWTSFKRPAALLCRRPCFSPPAQPAWYSSEAARLTRNNQWDQAWPHRKETSNVNVQLRRELGMFASVRPLKNLPALPARFQGVDMLVIRELTEDLYTAIEHEIVPGVVQSIKVVTDAASRRFFRFAFGGREPLVAGSSPAFTRRISSS